MATEDEIVKLVIDAENLSTDELKEAAANVDKLGDEAVRATKELQKLRVTKGQIESFEQLGQEVAQLDEDLAKAKVELDKNTQALKRNKEATDAERVAVEKQKLALVEQRKVVTATKNEFRKLSTELKEIGVTTQNAAARKEELNKSLVRAERAAKETRREYDRQAKALTNSIAKEKESIRVTKEKTEAHERAAKAVEKEANEKIESARADKIKAAEEARVTAATKKYELALEKLNAELKEGIITKGQYIKSEANLRRQLSLTEKQASVTRRAVEADAVVANKRRKSTDLLTTATRRLAQAYTVLIAAQKATQAVGASVKGYSDLEAAMTKVQKTTDLTRESLIDVTKELQELANEVTPTATNELLRYGEVAGQLGENAPEAIMNIVTAADALGLSTNLAGEEAVTLLTRMLKMSGEGTPAIHNLASAMVELGNNTAATEAELAHMTKEVLTGTQNLELGSAAAAGFAATLIESGQQAERSRGALIKLSSAIKTAAVKGGEDLERLSAVVGLTGEEIQKQLGDDKAGVIIRKFIQGLKGIKDEGGLAQETLAGFGITGTIANSVLGKLADASERLERNVKLSNDAFVAQDAHLKEAAKAYANQESQLGRLINRFTELKTRAGEAFADETYEAATALDNIMKENAASVAELANTFGEFTEFVVETVTQIEALADSFGLLDGAGAVITTLRVALNDLQIGINVITAAILQVRIAWAEWTGASVEEINKLREAQDEAFAAMESNIQDIADAEADWAGTSSATYRDLQDNANKYKDAIGRLSEEMQKEIEHTIQASNFKKEHNERYSELTAAIIRAQRELEIETKLRERQTAAEEKATAVKKQLAEEESRLAETISKYGDDVENYTVALEALTLAYRNGEISVDEYIRKVDDLDRAMQEVDKSQKVQTATQKIANGEFGKSSSIISSLTSSIRQYTNELTDLENKLERATEGTLEYNEISTKIAATQEKLKQSTRDLNTVRELEGKTLTQLIEIQRQHKLEVEQLEQSWQSGRLELHEYEKDKEALRLKTELLNKAIGEETSEIQKNTEALNENTDAIDQNTNSQGSNAKTTTKGIAAAKESTGAISLWLEMQNRLNRELDYSGETSEDLRAEYKKLAGEYRILRTTASGWWDDILEMNNAYVDNQRNAIEAELALRKYNDRLAEGSVNLQDLAKYAGHADRLANILGENQLRPLRDAIADARQEFADLSDTINESFADTQDRLDAILGNEKAIVKRQFEREMQELLDLLEQAKKSGDRALVNKINEAIRNLERAQQLEFEEQFGKSSESRNLRTNNQTSNNQNAVQNGLQPITINANGVPISFNAASQEDASSLMEALFRLGVINQAGVQ